MSSLPKAVAHDLHVARGYCPVISRYNSWCTLNAGHGGKHFSPRVPTPGQRVTSRADGIGNTNPAGRYWER